MIAPVDAVAQVRRPSQPTARVPVPPVPVPVPMPDELSIRQGNVDESRLSAPLANFDDGFSSDQGGGAYASGAETEKEVTDREEDNSPDRTPVWELPRAAAASRRMSTGAETPQYKGGDEEEEEDIVKTAKITIRPPKDISTTDEARASLLLHQHDSADMDADETTSPSSPLPTTITQSVSTNRQASPLSRHDSNSPNSFNQQLRQQYEIQAVSRPRPTTPVSASAIESFVAVNPRRTSEAEKMKISLPGSLFSNSSVNAPSAPVTQQDPQEPQQANAGSGSQRCHRRRSSMSWTEFQENMASSSYYTASGTGSGRVSGRTTPLSMAGDDEDLFDQNPHYQDRVPPSPVVHRRSSRDWVDFEGVIGGEEDGNGQVPAPPLKELVSEIEQTVTAWSQNDDYANERVPVMEEEQYAPPPPEEVNVGMEYSQTTGEQEQPPPPEPYHYYGYTVPEAPQESYYGNTGLSSSEMDSSYPPPPSPFPAPAQPAPLDHWSSQTQSTVAGGGISGDEWSRAQPGPGGISGAQSSVGGISGDEWSRAQPGPGGISGAQSSVGGISGDEWSRAQPGPGGISGAQSSVGGISGDEWSRAQPGPGGISGAQSSVGGISGDEWSRAQSTVGGISEPTAPTAVPIQYVQDDWDDSPYAKMQMDYQQQPAPPPPPPPEPNQAPVPPSLPSRSAPPPPRPPPAAPTEPSQSQNEQNASEDWLAYERMTQKMNMVVKQSQEKLQEIQKETVARTLPSTPYEVSVGSVVTRQTTIDTRPTMVSPPKVPIDLLSSDFEPSVNADQGATATPQSSSGSESAKEWKPIHEVLNEEIKKQKELQKPKRPPPPKTAPQRPPRPGQAPTSVASWDEPSTVPSHAPSLSYPAYPSWDDAGPTVDTFSASKPTPIDYSSSIPFSTGPPSVSTPLVPSSVVQSNSPPMEKSIPFTESDMANQNNLQSEDDSLFDVSKFSNLVSAEHDDFDIFLKKDQSPKAPPIPPPRSPGPERTFIIEKDDSSPITVQPGQSDRSAQSKTSGWADFDTSSTSADIQTGLPPSESDFYLKMTNIGSIQTSDPFAPQPNPPHQTEFDLLGSVSAMEDSYDPFAVQSPDQIVAEAKAKAQAQISAREAVDDLDFFGGSTTTREMEKSQEEEIEEPGFGFRDDFAPPAGAPGGNTGDDEDEDTSPLYEEDDSQPLLDFPPKFTGDGWEMMLRFPVKKKMMAERCWKPVYVRLQGSNVELYYGKNDRLPFQTLPLLANYSLSDVTTQQYDVYGKIHTVKLQYVIYKEKVGLRPGQIPKLVEGHFTKLGLPLEHAAQTSVLLKFGSLHHDEMQSFVYAVEDVLFHITAVRERPALYKQDEIQVHCYDEYACHVNKDGAVSDQRARVRIFCLSFVSGMPYTEIGLNDRRRQGKEVVRRKDIMPMYTERWIRFEALQFHSSVHETSFDKEHVIKMQPLDACFFELMRFRVRPPRGKELPLQVRSIMKIAGSKIEIRIEAMVAVFKSRKARQVPCEDIQIRFPVPEAWIYLFREERHWGYGSVHAKVRRPGKVKNIRDKIMGMVQNADSSLIEVAIGDAKYEHVYRSLVWRIPRLPEKHHGAYKTHLLRCRFELSSFDLMPETFVPNCEVEYTMPMATVSHTVVRSVSIEQHEDPDKVEKWVRYLAKYQYTVDIDYVQTTDLDIEAIMDTTVLEPEKSLEKAPAKHQPSLDIGVAKEAHEGYRIDFSETEFGGGRYDKSDGDGGKKSSSDSSDDDDIRDSRKPPLIQIDMSSYKY